MTRVSWLHLDPPPPKRRRDNCRCDLGRILADFGGKFSLRTLPAGGSIRPHLSIAH